VEGLREPELHPAHDDGTHPVIGGSSIDGMISRRGQKHDAWAAANKSGRAWDDALPLFHERGRHRSAEVAAGRSATEGEAECAGLLVCLGQTR